MSGVQRKVLLFSAGGNSVCTTWRCDRLRYFRGLACAMWLGVKDTGRSHEVRLTDTKS